MAIVTHQAIIMAGGAIVFSYDFDDVTGDVHAIRCVNTSGRITATLA